MTTLKELTSENHKRAEESWFAKELLSGEIDPILYYVYIYNQSYNYDILEQKIPLEMLGVGSIARYDRIRADMEELEQEHGIKLKSTDILLRSTVDYTRHIMRLESINPRGMLAHLYVRHFGDMFGGAIVAKRTPGKGRMYEFEDKTDMIARVRALLELDMADEANTCFDFAIRLFGDLEEWWYEFSLENPRKSD